MTGKHKPPLYLEMPFAEAMERFAGTDPKELPEKSKLGKRDPESPRPDPGISAGRKSGKGRKA